MIACGWATGISRREGPIGAEDRSYIAESIINTPIAGYPIVRVGPPVEGASPTDHRANGVTFHATTPLADPGLSGLFEVRYVTSAVALAYSPGIVGYQIFVTVPQGYLIVIVAYRRDVRVAAVLRPGGKPPHLTMTAFLDLAFEALGIEAVDHEVDL